MRGRIFFLLTNFCYQMLANDVKLVYNNTKETTGGAIWQTG